jgi:hypothetical protein
LRLRLEPDCQESPARARNGARHSPEDQSGYTRTNNDGLHADVRGADPILVRNAVLLHVELLTLLREDAWGRALLADVGPYEKRYGRNIREGSRLER